MVTNALDGYEDYLVDDKFLNLVAKEWDSSVMMKLSRKNLKR